MSSDDSNLTRIAQPVLDYATRDADGLPAWVPEAEKLIDDGCRPRELQLYFRKSQDVVKYFAKSMARRHGPETLGDRCAGCGADAGNRVIGIQWAAHAPPRFLEFRVSSQEINAPFTTLHPVCGTCSIRWVDRLVKYQRPRAWLRLIGFSFFAFWILTIVLQSIPPIRSYLAQWLPRRSVLVLFWGTGLTVFLMSSTLTQLWRARCPRALKRMMPRDVVLLGISGYFIRENGTLRSLTD